MHLGSTLQPAHRTTLRRVGRSAFFRSSRPGPFGDRSQAVHVAVFRVPPGGTGHGAVTLGTRFGPKVYTHRPVLRHPDMTKVVPHAPAGAELAARVSFSSCETACFAAHRGQFKPFIGAVLLQAPVVFPTNTKDLLPWPAAGVTAVGTCFCRHVLSLTFCFSLPAVACSGQGATSAMTAVMSQGWKGKPNGGSTPGTSAGLLELPPLHAGPQILRCPSAANQPPGSFVTELLYCIVLSRCSSWTIRCILRTFILIRNVALHM